jgi:hypothetical protein
MRRFIPHRHELVIFGCLAILFAVVVSMIHPQTSDLGMAGLGAPMFLVAAVLGLRRSPQWTTPVVEETESEEG